MRRVGEVFVAGLLSAAMGCSEDLPDQSPTVFTVFIPQGTLSAPVYSGTPAPTAPTNSTPSPPSLPTAPVQGAGGQPSVPFGAGECPAPWLHCESYWLPRGCVCNTGGPLLETDCASGEHLYCEQRPAMGLLGAGGDTASPQSSGLLVRVDCRCLPIPSEPSDCLHPGQFTCESYEPFTACRCDGQILPEGVCDPPASMLCENLEVPYGCTCLR